MDQFNGYLHAQRAYDRMTCEDVDTDEAHADDIPIALCSLCGYSVYESDDNARSYNSTLVHEDCYDERMQP